MTIKKQLIISATLVAILTILAGVFNVLTIKDCILLTFINILSHYCRLYIVMNRETDIKIMELIDEHRKVQWNLKVDNVDLKNLYLIELEKNTVLENKLESLQEDFIYAADIIVGEGPVKKSNEKKENKRTSTEAEIKFDSKDRKPPVVKRRSKKTKD